ncbi:Carbonic anhydrase 2, partial [Caligus rogercresseyi]
KNGIYHLTSYVTPLQLKVSNNGHTAQSLAAHNFQGPLPGAYELAQFHFHWGVNDSLGSEHTFDEQKFPWRFTSIKEAVQKVGKGDNLAITKEDNKKIEPLIQSLENVRKEGTTFRIPNKFSLRNLLPHRKDGMFVYNGSLTTPGCNEFVLWNVFEVI